MEEIGINLQFKEDLLESIKQDDVKRFKEITTDERMLTLCFGRFPILSMLYLYDSNKILSKYESKLKKITGYTFVDEDIEVYELFKVKAKRSLRLYKDTIVSYMDMLAILGDGVRLNKETKELDKDSIDSILKTYSLSNDKKIKEKKGKVIFKAKSISKKDKTILSFVSSFLIVMIILSSLLIVFSNGVSDGSINKPYNISSEKLFDSLSTTTNFVSLISDVNLKNKIENFNMNLDGKGKTITINNLDGPIISNLNGSIKNLNIIIKNSSLLVSSSTAFFAVLNNGTIENVTLTLKDASIKVLENDEENQDTTFIGGLTSFNYGLIKSSKIMVENLDVEGYTHVNGYLGLLASKNLGTISTCETSGDINTDTVDVASISAENDGLIDKTINHCNIIQSSSSTSWNPNVSGIAGINYQSITNCINYGNIKGISTASFEGVEKSSLQILASGICAQNAGSIEKCLNKGNIEAKANDTSILVGGISSYSYGSIISCGTIGDIKGETTKDNICMIGGLCARVAEYISGFYVVALGSIKNSYSISNLQVLGTIEDKNIYLGGVCGVCSGYIYQVYEESNGLNKYLENIAYLKDLKDIVSIGYIDTSKELDEGFAFLSVDGYLSKEEILNSEVYFDETDII